jgi:hypothetical protein
MNKTNEPMNPLFFNRTVSHLLKLFIIPEIEKRIANNSITKDKLPIEIKQFRASQKQEPTGNFTPIVEINEEVKLIAQVKMKNKISPGNPVMLGDIVPEECYITPPEYDGVPAGYFYWRSTFLNYIFIFDLSHNVPKPFQDELPTKIHLPILEFINANNFIKIIKPLEKFRLLASNNWPPSPGYCPQIMNIIHNNTTIIEEESFIKQVADIFNEKYWEDKVNFWKETGFFNKRIQYIERAIKAHYEDDYIASIYVIAPQFEGIMIDYLKKCAKTVPAHFPDIIKAFKDICLSRKIMLYPREVLEVILDFIDNKAFWKPSVKVKDKRVEINRHGIAHGTFTDFECKEVSLKLLILFDGLAFVLLNDKIVSGDL